MLEQQIQEFAQEIGLNVADNDPIPRDVRVLYQAIMTWGQSRSNLIELLLENGTDPNYHHPEIAYYHFQTPLHCAIVRNNTDAAKSLIDYGADIHKPHRGRLRRQIRGSNSNSEPCNLMTPLDIAIDCYMCRVLDDENPNLKMIHVLLQAGAKPLYYQNGHHFRGYSNTEIPMLDCLLHSACK